MQRCRGDYAFDSGAGRGLSHHERASHAAAVQGCSELPSSARQAPTLPLPRPGHARGSEATVGALLIRAPNWLGDTVMALPALHALRRTFAETRITVVGRWASMLDGQGVADTLLHYPHEAGERRRLARALRAAPSDLAILLPNSLESALAAWRWRARRRLGFDSDGRRLLLTDPVPRSEPRRHQVDEYLTLAHAAGADGIEGEPRFVLPPGPERPAQVDRVLEAAGVTSARPLVGLHLGAAGGTAKLWPAERYAALGGALFQARLTPVLLGGPPDVERAALVVTAAHPRPASLVGMDRPALLPWLLARLDCLVSGDTGVAHLAAALGVPTVTLFGPTSPTLTAPRGRSARVLVGEAPCAPCFLSSCPIEHVCLDAIAVDVVARAAVEATAR